MSAEPADDGVVHTRATPSSRFRRRRWAAVALVLLALLLVVRGLLVETFTVPSGSMESTLDVGDRIVVWKPSAGSVQRGDVVVFDARSAFGVGDQDPSAWHRWADALGIRTEGTAYVKRVIGVGGDRIAMNSAGVVRRNGAVLSEPYARPGSGLTPFDVQVPPGRLFVMGDHRNDSDDSRAHLGDPGGGTVPVEDVIGQVSGRYWPLSRFGGVDQAEQ